MQSILARHIKEIMGQRTAQAVRMKLQGVMRELLVVSGNIEAAAKTITELEERRWKLYKELSDALDKEQDNGKRNS